MQYSVQPCSAAFALAFGFAFATSAGAQTARLPLTYPGPVEAHSAEKLGNVFGVHGLSDGRVFINDAIGKRLLMFDSTLTRVTVVAAPAEAPNLYKNTPVVFIPGRADTTLILDTTDPAAYARVTGYIASAYNFSAWDGPGILTTRPAALAGLTTVAIATGEQVLGIAATETGVFAGQTVGGRSVILKYTYAGDANFDGIIDASDYGLIDNYFQFPGTSGYFNGDFNFDGVIDAGDYGIIDNSFQLQGPPL
jgi:hypothetical protein